MAIEHSGTAAEQAQAKRSRAAVRRASVGRTLVALAIFAPAVTAVLALSLLHNSIYSHRIRGPLWPWIVADIAVLGIGVVLMRGEDL